MATQKFFDLPERTSLAEIRRLLPSLTPGSCWVNVATDRDLTDAHQVKSVCLVKPKKDQLRLEAVLANGARVYLSLRYRAWITEGHRKVSGYSSVSDVRDAEQKKVLTDLYGLFLGQDVRIKHFIQKGTIMVDEKDARHAVQNIYFAQGQYFVDTFQGKTFLLSDLVPASIK